MKKLINWPTSILGIVLAIGITPVSNGKTAINIVHSHFTAPSIYDLASTKVLSDYVDTKGLVQTYEYQYKEHIDSYEGIIRDNKDNPDRLKVKEQIWKAHKERIINQLKYHQERLKLINDRRLMLADGNVPKV